MSFIQDLKLKELKDKAKELKDKMDNNKKQIWINLREKN